MAGAIVPDYSQTYKHIFTSPSSVDEVMKATRSGNARIHGMTQVTSPSIVYIATQVWSSPEACQIYNHFFRHGLPSVPHLYSPGQIQSQIQNTFTRVYWLTYYYLLTDLLPLTYYSTETNMINACHIHESLWMMECTTVRYQLLLEDHLNESSPFVQVCDLYIHCKIHVDFDLSDEALVILVN